MVKDLTFIRQHLRYPINRFTMMPAVMAAILISFGAFTIWWFTTQHGSSNAGDRPLWPFLLVGCAMSVPGLVAARRHLVMLRFIAVPTPYYLTENTAILIQFLKAQHLMVFRHPEAPEVFQILSKNINPFREEREIIIFIADEKRILINSHFTTSGTSLNTGAVHHHQMADALRRWLAAYAPPPPAALVHQHD